MQTATLVMQMSTDDALATVVTALHAMPSITIAAPAWTTYLQLVITIDTADPDTVDIVREIIWQFDPMASQHSVHLDIAG